MRLIFGALGIALIIVGIQMGGHLSLFIDLPSVAIVVGCTVLFTFAHHSFANTIAAFTAALGSSGVSPAEAKKHVRVLSTTRVLASASGVVGSLIGLVCMLANLDDPKTIGPAMAVALLTIFYGVIIAELCVASLINRLRNRMEDNSADDDAMKPSLVTFAALPMTLIAFFAMLTSFNLSGA